MTRNSYPKGVAKREEILKNALEVIAQRGFNRATLRELADAADLSITGLLHHFGTKEELLTSVLRRRDELDVANYYQETPDSIDSMVERLSTLVRHNTDVPGLVKVYTNLSADATASDHPAHEYFRSRYERGREIGRESVTHLKESGHLPPEVDADDLTLLMIAMVDGLQLLWQFDESIDMARTLETFGRILRLAERGSQHTDQTPHPDESQGSDSANGRGGA
ncbi:TetR/AcrR family transcriptional regulator [Arthrobacter sp. efr-133-TYG-118]|uniref:TetR/AcrR family transcriptional regulator n=1 Tax=Arthrobacter sp. efr-133-TYG-118 TaxID=3040279 RepID=UPI00254FAE25|nr:TetR/AcrR family transcriptional regulator [Arthrobacter sp. efr-133-TYG-118]